LALPDGRVLIVVRDTLTDKKAVDLLALDMRKVSSVADYFVLGSGTSRLHVQSLADAVEAALLALGMAVRRREGYREARWVCLDFGDIVVHLFQPEVRRYFDMERLWSDAPRVSLLSLDGNTAVP
jgi:ribosome-associated protein